MIEPIRLNIIDLLNETALDYSTRGLIFEAELFQAHDIHIFYRLSAKPQELVHVQAYPGMSNNLRLSIMARIMDYNQVRAIRTRNLNEERPRIISPGNEHQAVIRMLSNFPCLTSIPYEKTILQQALAVDIVELR